MFIDFSVVFNVPQEGCDQLDDFNSSHTKFQKLFYQGGVVYQVKGFQVIDSDSSSSEAFVSALEGFICKFDQVVGCTTAFSISKLGWIIE